MALTKVAGDILDPGISIAGVVTATAFDGPFRGGSGSDVTAGVGTFTQLDINGPADFTGIVTFSHTQDSTSASTGTIQVAGGVGIAKSVYIGGDLVVNGTTTTIDTTLKAVDRIEVADNSTNVAVAITQSGSGDIFNLYDGSTEVFSVADGGVATFVKGINVTSGIITATTDIHVGENIAHLGDTDTKLVLTDNQIDLQTGGSSRVYVNNYGIYVKSGLGLGFLATTGPSPAIKSGGTNNQDLLLTTGTDNPTRISITGIGSVGIGTDNPAKKLEVWDATQGVIRIRGGGAGSNSSRKADLSLFASGAREYVVRADASDAEFKIIDVSGSNAERFIINSSGEVDVPGGLIGRAVSDSFTLNNVKQPHYGLRLGVGSTVPVGISGYYGIAFASNGSEKVRIASNGRVGIGITNPDGNLHVHNSSAGSVTAAGDANELVLESAANVGMSFLTANDALSRIKFGDPDATNAGIIIYSHADDSLRFQHTSNERLRITSEGKVLVGSGVTNGSLLNVKGQVGFADDGTNAGIIISTDDANGAAIHCLTTGGFTNGSYGIMRLNAVQHKFTYGNTQRLLIDSTGLATFGGEIASAQDYPNYRPTLDFNFAAVKKLDPRIAYSRTGPASYIDEFGIVKLVGAHIPRFDHDQTTRECKGLLIEESRTNQIADSFDLTGSNWVPVNLDRTPFTTETLAPNGKYEATKIIPTTASNQHYTNFGSMTKANGAERQCVSFWAKISSSNYPILKSYITGAGAFTNYSEARFNLSTGAVDGVSGSGGFTNHSVKMTEYPNGWYKCEYEATLNSSETTKRFQLLANNGSSDAGNGTDGYYIWGVQVEVGDFPTSHIPTSGNSTATRGADVVTIEGEEFSDFYNQNEGTLVLSASYTGDIRTSAAVTIDDTSNESEYTEIGYRAGGGGSGAVASYIRTDAGNDQYFKQYASSATQGNEFKVALAYKDDDYASSVNGQTVDTDTSGTTSKVYDRLRFSDVDTVGVVGSGYYRRFMYYAKRITNSQLVTLTS